MISKNKNRFSLIYGSDKPLCLLCGLIDSEKVKLREEIDEYLCDKCFQDVKDAVNGGI